MTALIPFANSNQLAPDKAATPNNAVQVRMRNVMYHYADNISVHIRALRGDVVPTPGNPIPVFDDKNSFILRIAAAAIAINSASMTNVINAHISHSPDSPIRDISIRIESNELKVRGRLHKGGIPFEVDGTVSATSNGKIRLRAKSIKAVKLPVKKLMDLFGADLAGVIQKGKLPGIEAEGDDLILDPQQLLPPPRIVGKVSEVRLEGNNIVQTFGAVNKHDSDPTDGNYMYYQANRLRFGKLTMSDTDLKLLDMDPRDPFDFYLDHYKDQLVAGYTKTTPGFGLRVYMRDFNKLSSSTSKTPVKSQASTNPASAR